MKNLRLVILISALSSVLSYGAKSLLVIKDLDTNCVCVKNQEGIEGTWQVQCSDKQTKEIVPCIDSYGKICQRYTDPLCDPNKEEPRFFVADFIPSIPVILLGLFNLLSFCICVISILIYLASKLKMLVEPKKSYRNRS